MTSLAFRNLDIEPDAAVRDWPPEAVETALDRGTLSDWRRLAAEIRRSPWGPTSRTIATMTAWGEHPGGDALMIATIERARRDVGDRGRRRWAEFVRGLRARTGLTLREFAALAGTSASRLSDYERAKVSPTTEVLARLEHAAAVATVADGAAGD